MEITNAWRNRIEFEDRYSLSVFGDVKYTCECLNTENRDRLKYVGQLSNETALKIDELMKFIGDREEWKKLLNPFTVHSKQKKNFKKKWNGYRCKNWVRQARFKFQPDRCILFRTDARMKKKAT